jgi:hypothetical protein
MGKHNFVVLCLRLLGIYFFILGLSSLPNVFSMFVESLSNISYFFISPIILIVSGFVLYIFAPGIGLHVIQFSEAEEGGLHISASEKTTRIALLVLGIFIFADALPQLIQTSFNVASYYQRIDEIPEHLREAQSRWTYIIGPFIKLIIGTVLIIGPDKVIGFLAKYDDQFKRLKSSNQTNAADR